MQSSAGFRQYDITEESPSWSDEIFRDDTPLPLSPSPRLLRPSQVFHGIAALDKPVWFTLSVHPSQRNGLWSSGEDERVNQLMPSGADRRQIFPHGEEAENDPLLPPDRRDSALDTQSEESDRRTGKPERANWHGNVLQRIGIPITRIVHRIIWLSPFTLIVENLGRLLTTNLYYTSSSIIFVPLGILASMLNWKPELIVIFNALAVGSASFLAAVLAEDLVQSTLHLGFLAELVFTNTAWLFIGILALLRGDLLIIQTIIPGSILTRDILFLGMAFLAGGFFHRVQHINSRTVVSTMTALKIVGFIPPAVCSLLFLDHKHRQPSSPPPPDDSTYPLLFFSRSLSLVSLTIYALYYLFRTTTHTPLFTDPEASSNNPSNPTRPRPRGPSRPRSVTACLLLTMLLTVFSSSTLLLAALPRPAPAPLLTTLLPLLLHHAELPALVRASGTRPARALVATCGATLHAILFCAPALVVLGWAGGRAVGLGLDSSASVAGVVVFGTGAWVGGVVVQDGRGDYLKGVVLLALYCIIAVAVFLLPA